MPDDPFTQWAKERPPEVQELMVDWPPDARVRAREGVSLMVPGPGVEGRVASWFENGMVGIEAPVLEGGPIFRAECDPDDLEVIGYATYGNTELTPDVIRGVLA